MTWQSAPASALPPALQEDNPWRLPRRVDGRAGAVNAPLDGILVADFSRVLAGPLATMTLADLGAEVVKVERPGAGDDTRQWGPPWTEQGSSYFECVNRSKQSITLDLRLRATSRSRGAGARADVLVENFLTGTMDRLGLGYDEVAALNPRLVYCSITGFGSGAVPHSPGTTSWSRPSAVS